MSKHNYTQYSNTKKKHSNREDAVTTVASTETQPLEIKMVVEPSETAPELVAETVETVALPETVEGVVVNCAKLNVRAKPEANAEVVHVLDTMSEIVINVNKSTEEWFSVCTASGVEGYCMRKFVNASL